MIAATEADAFVFDVFSNPDAMQIKERLQAFVDIIVAKHPKMCIRDSPWPVGHLSVI